MKQHGFILPKLSEFFPDNPNLLGQFLVFVLKMIQTESRDYTGVNCNRGERICIRLRHRNSRNPAILTQIATEPLPDRLQIIHRTPLSNWKNLSSQRCSTN